MKKKEKFILGNAVFELFKTVSLKVENLEKELDRRAESSYCSYQSVHNQIEKIIDIIMRLDKLRQLRERLHRCAMTVKREYRELFFSLVHPDLKIRESFAKLINNKFKYRMGYFRYLDKMFECFYDNFFDNVWTPEYLEESFKEEKVIATAIQRARAYRVRAEEKAKQDAKLRKELQKKQKGEIA